MNKKSNEKGKWEQIDKDRSCRYNLSRIKKGGMSMRRAVAFALMLVLLLGFAGCAKEVKQQPVEEPKPDPTGPFVGICLPEDSNQWKENARLLEKELKTLGFEVKTEYAQADPQMQINQIKAMAEGQASCLVIAPVDAMALTQELETSDIAGIPVVAYDWQLTDLESADGAAGFDYFAIGRALGEYIVSAKELKTAEEAYTVEFIMGSAEDSRALQLHMGLMQILQPYLDTGVLVCPSGRTAFADTYTIKEDPETAAQKLSKYLAEHYEKEQLDILCVASDEMAAACAEALTDAGYTEENWPLITGQGGLPEALKQIIAGKQTVTVYKDRPALAKACAQVVSSLATGAVIPEETSYQNIVVDSKNYEEKLVKTGIYSKKDLKS